MNRPPTEKQMIARMHDGHRDILRGYKPAGNPSIGSIRGHMKARGTLIEWGAITPGGRDNDDAVTDLGRRLLEGWYARYPASRPGREPNDRPEPNPLPWSRVDPEGIWLT